MPEAFESPTLKKREEYLKFWDACPQKVSTYSFGSLWAWREHYGLEWAFGGSHVRIRQTLPEIVNWAPVGPWTTTDWAHCPVLTRGGTFFHIPETLARMWQKAHPQRVQAERDRPSFEYVYSVSDLIRLRGNKFKSKRHLLNHFVKNYDYEYSPLTPEDLKEALDMQRQWFALRNSGGDAFLAAENRAIDRVFKNWKRLSNFTGGILRVNGQMAAYTVAEALNNETLVIHFEKGHPEFKGVYQAINQMFLKNAAPDFTYVNHAEDLGLKGLRQAKLSYNPLSLMKIFKVNLPASTMPKCTPRPSGQCPMAWSKKA